MGKEIFKNSSKARYCNHFSPNIGFIVQSITPILKSNYGDTSLKLLFYFHIVSFLSDILDFSYWNLMQPGTTLGVFPGVSGNQCTPVITHEQKEWARKLVVKLESSFCLNKSCTPWNEYGWQESLSLLDHRYFWIDTSTSGKVNTMSLNGVIFNLVWKVTLLCFGFALLRNAIGVELKLAPYFKSVRLKIKSNRDLVTFVFSRFGKITRSLLLLLIILLTFILLWFWFYNTQLKCFLRENPVDWAYLKKDIYVKLLNCSSSRFWFIKDSCWSNNFSFSLLHLTLPVVHVAIHRWFSSC